jgi:hypothetical protein
VNVYYSPEKFGLTMLGEIELAGGYEYDKFVVWRRDDGSLTWASDTGCSCPTPFDEIGLNEMPTGDRFAAMTAAKGWLESHWSSDGTPAEQMTDYTDLALKVMA